jgi:hypothetical protein
MSLSKALEWRRSVQRPRQLFFTETPALLAEGSPAILVFFFFEGIQQFLLVPLFNLLFSHFFFYSYSFACRFRFLTAKEGWVEVSFSFLFFKER